MQQEFKAHIENGFSELLENPFLLACSGGVDSAVLAHLCHTLQMHFVLGHCNFQLRGVESDADEAFVLALAQAYGVPCWTTRFDTVGYQKEHALSLQMAARELRYTWFDTVLKRKGLHYVVTAHQADDSLETFLINLSRGTGIEGLMGIPEKRDTIRRPLLAFSRTEILDYAKSQNLDWREDSSNSETKYLRNKIRQEIVPQLKELHPSFLQNFGNTQKHLKQISQITENHKKELENTLFERKQGFVQISIADLSKLNPIKAYLHLLFKEYGFTEWDDVESLLRAMSGKEVRSRTHRLVKDRSTLLLAPIMNQEKHIFHILEHTHLIREPIHLKIETVAEMGNTGKNILYVDKETLKYPVTLRKWKKGDYFYPLGMWGKKKLSKFFKDEKIDVLSKENQWLLCSEDEIVWVIGRRPDERFKVAQDTREILRFETEL